MLVCCVRSFVSVFYFSYSEKLVNVFPSYRLNPVFLVPIQKLPDLSSKIHQTTGLQSTMKYL